jgi:hypothetical protein
VSLPLAIRMFEWIKRIAFKNSIKKPKKFLPPNDIWLQLANQKSNISNSLNP